MRFQRVAIGLVLVAVGLGTTAGPMAASGEQTKAKQAEPEKKPAELPKGNLDKLEVVKLNEILDNQRRLLDRLDTLEGSTLPNAFHGVQNSILDGLASTEAAIIHVIGGLELACSTADVLPLPAPGIAGPSGFCQYDAANTQLRIRVHNQGGVATGPFTTRVSFFGGVVVDLPTPPLAGFGGAVDLFTDIPNSCFGNVVGDSACPFTIAVDVDDVVIEANEPNNLAEGVCFRVG